MGIRVSVRYRYPTLVPIRAARIDVGGDERASLGQYCYVVGTYEYSQNVHERLIRSFDT